MKRQLLESRYRFNLNHDEAKAARSTGNSVRVINKINRLSGVRGITFCGDHINVVVHSEEGDNLIDHVQSILSKELL